LFFSINNFIIKNESLSILIFFISIIRFLKSFIKNKNKRDNKNNNQKVEYLKFIVKVNVSLEAKDVIYINKINIPPIKIKKRE
jgi:hypothetical protein